MQGKWTQNLPPKVVPVWNPQLSTNRLLAVQAPGEEARRPQGRGSCVSIQAELSQGLNSVGMPGKSTLVETNCPGVLMAGLPGVTDWYKKGP